MKMRHIPALFIVMALLSGCLQLGTQVETPTPLAATEIVPTATPVQPELVSLTVCLGQEPNSLYPFGELNSAARSILAAVYDGPFDTISYEYAPVILTQIPSIENGDGQIVKTQVKVGDQVLDADGNIAAVAEGLRVRPAGCTSDDCAITYDGLAPLEMDQMIVTFRLRPDLTWSDGTPLTADDSIYSFEVQKGNNVNKFLVDRTQVYEAADPQTLQWFGMPGFIDQTYFTNFWTPAPKHIWSEFSPEQLAESDVASREPLGWGPFKVDEWRPGESITLSKNPYYFRATDGFPKLDVLKFRFTPDPDTALSDLIAGSCDILDPSINLENHVGLLQEMQTAEQAQVFYSTGMSIEWLGLGLVPASYDNGYDIQKDRQDLFADLYTRQGIAYCLDRQSIVDNTLFGLTTVPTTYVPIEHPVFDENIKGIPYDPQIGISLLEQAGWLDEDNDPSTPRRALNNVENVSYNAVLELNYYTTTSTQRRQVAGILEKSLEECGIGLNVKYLTANELYTGGPNGLLLGRQFDLAEYALGVDGIEAPCEWFTSSEMPSAENLWSGTNVTGFKNKDYDQACRDAQLALRDGQEYLNAIRQTEILFSENLPAIPLYYRLRIAAARPDVCQFQLDATANPLWNIEAIGVGDACQN